MRGWSSFIAGFLLLALAYWLYTLGGFGSEAIICGIAAAGFILQGAFGLGVGAGAESTGLIEFIHNPADAIVDSATDKLADWLRDDTPRAEPEKQQPTAEVPVQPYKFQHGDAIARYWDQREAESAAPIHAPPQRSFGRKGA